MAKERKRKRRFSSLDRLDLLDTGEERWNSCELSTVELQTCEIRFTLLSFRELFTVESRPHILMRSSRAFGADTIEAGNDREQAPEELIRLFASSCKSTFSTHG